MNKNTLKYKRKKTIERNKRFLKISISIKSFFRPELELKEALLIIKSGLFDYEWYLEMYPDIKKLNYGIIEAAKHYNKYGWIENRNPSNMFYTESFVAKNETISFKSSPLVFFINNIKKYRERNLRELQVTEELYRSTNKGYKSWIRENEKINQNEILEKIKEFKILPKISILVPVYNPDPELLILCIESIQKQSYKNWQLCLADDCSTDKRVKEVLNKYSTLDENIEVVFRDKNGHISAASNSALNIASGEWTALVDHDDELPINALYYVVSEINSNPKTEFIYSDEDKINEKGERYEPHFKSDFNLDLLYSQNYISHLGVYKTKILKEINGFRLGVEGSQDYDLLLRYLEKVNYKNIVHIPKVLYHWRAVTGSTALGASEKSYTTEAGIKALTDYFYNKKEPIKVEKGKVENTYKVNWPIEGNPLVSLIIPTYNGYEITKLAIESILEKTSYRNFEILLVDNNSDDEQSLKYFDSLKNHTQIKVLKYPKPFNYSAINNFAVEEAKGEILGLINNDIEVINPGWLSEMLSHAVRKDIGCVGAMLYYPNDTIQHAGVILGIGGVAGHSHKYFDKKSFGYFSRLQIEQNLSAVTAACLLVRKDIYNEVGGLNEEKLKIAFNDVDFCLKVDRAGYRNLWTPYAELYHHESISRGHEDTPEKKERFDSEIKYMMDTWKNKIENDPYYNPNLTLKKENFSIR